jgi:hypothetical protein
MHLEVKREISWLMISLSLSLSLSLSNGATGVGLGLLQEFPPSFPV